MNPAKCDAVDYIQFLVAAQKRFTCSEAARCQPESPQAPAHDAFTRLLRRQPPGTEALWQETRGLVRREEGVLVLDDTTLDKPYAKRMELVSRHWSGKHKRVVWGINLLTLLWTDGNALIPCDFLNVCCAGGGGGAGLSKLVLISGIRDGFENSNRQVNPEGQPLATVAWPG